MNTLILRFVKVQVMTDDMFATLIDRVEDEIHIELTPTLLAQQERRLLEYPRRIRKRRMQLIRHLVEYRRRQFFAVGADQEHPDRPLAHGKALLRGDICTGWVSARRTSKHETQRMRRKGPRVERPQRWNKQNRLLRNELDLSSDLSPPTRGGNISKLPLSLSRSPPFCKHTSAIFPTRLLLVFAVVRCAVLAGVLPVCAVKEWKSTAQFYPSHEDRATEARGDGGDGGGESDGLVGLLVCVGWGMEERDGRVDGVNAACSMVWVTCSFYPLHRHCPT